VLKAPHVLIAHCVKNTSC